MNYLLLVPKLHKKWFRDYYDTIKLECEESELINYSMLENNIFGINERGLNWNIDLNGLIDDLVQNKDLQPEKTNFIIDCLVCALEDCQELEYFEMAHNIDLIVKAYDNALFEKELNEEVYYILNPNDNEPF